MSDAAQHLNLVLPFCYAIAAATSVWIFVSDAAGPRRIERPLLGVVLLVHAAALGFTAAAAARCPLGTVFEAMGLAAFAMTAVYFGLSFRREARATGVLILPIAFLLVTAGTIFRRMDAAPNENLSNPWFAVHAAAALFGVAALGVSFVHGALYLLQYRQLKRKRFGFLYHRLPPLTSLARTTQGAAVVGWALLATTLGAGAVWARAAGRSGEILSDPMFLVTAGAFVLYTVGLAIRYLAGWRGRYTAWLSVGGFSLLLAAILFASFLFPTLHEFY